jgi:hypothetical protein
MATIAESTTAPTGAEQAPTRAYDARSRIDSELRRLLDPFGCRDLADLLERIAP